MTVAAMKDPQAELEKVRAWGEKKFGKGIIHTASESLPVNRLPFVEPNLNYATEGGPGFGRFMAMYGDENSGKSRIAFELIAQAQQLPYSAEAVLIPRIAYHAMLSQDPSLSDEMRARHHTRTERLINELDWIRATFPNGADAVYYNAEQQFDPVWAEHIGIDLDRLVIVESTTIEEIVELMQNYYPHVPLHVVDSTSNASTYLSQKHEVGKSLMGVDARQWKVCLRDSLPFFDPQRNIAILIHQLSTDIRSGAVKAQATRYMRFVSRLSVRFYHGKALYMKNGVLQLDPEKVGDEYDGREVFAKIEKSTVGRPFREASLQWDFNRGEFVAPHELASSALKFGLVMGGGPGGWYKTAEGERIGQGLKSVYAWLANDEEVRNQITCRLLDYTHER